MVSVLEKCDIVALLTINSYVLNPACSRSCDVSAAFTATIFNEKLSVWLLMVYL